MRWHILGAILLCTQAALAAPAPTTTAPPSDAPATAGPTAPAGPSGSAAPIDPYGPDTNAPATSGPATTAPDTSGPAAPAPSQQPAPAQAPAPGTTPTTEPPNAPPAPAKPASEQLPNPPTDKPAPAPVDQPAPRKNDTQSSVPAPTIDVASAPPACRSAGKLVSSPDRNAAAAAKVSLALCVANAQLSPLQLVDAEASIQDVDAATAAALAMLDEVAAAGQPHWQVVALHAEGDLLVTMSKRMLATVPATGASDPQSAVALHDSRMAMLQPRVQPWLDRAQQAFGEVDRIAKAHPELSRQQQAADAITDSRKRLTTGVATR